MKSVIRYWPDLENLKNIANKIIKDLPKDMRKVVKNISISLDNFPDQTTLSNLKLESRYDLLGLYRGVPLSQKPSRSQETEDRIFLYRAPIIRYSIESGENIYSIVKNVILYEIHHHIGHETRL